MYPLGHAAVAYLAYAIVVAVVAGRRPRRRVVLVLLVVSQLPDLIDKPLVYIGILSSGRSLGHSLIMAGLVIILAYVVVERGLMQETSLRADATAAAPIAVAIGYVSHLCGDAIGPLIAGRVGELRFLFWPIVAPLEYPSDDISPLVRLLEFYRPPFSHPQTDVIIIAVVVALSLEVWHLSRRNTK